MGTVLWVQKHQNIFLIIFKYRWFGDCTHKTVPTRDPLNYPAENYPPENYSAENYSTENYSAENYSAACREL